MVNSKDLTVKINHILVYNLVLVIFFFKIPFHGNF